MNVNRRILVKKPSSIVPGTDFETVEVYFSVTTATISHGHGPFGWFDVRTETGHWISYAPRIFSAQTLDSATTPFDDTDYWDFGVVSVPRNSLGECLIRYMQRGRSIGVQHLGLYNPAWGEILVREDLDRADYSCLVTTTAVEALGYEETCVEMVTMRKLRDNYVAYRYPQFVQFYQLASTVLVERICSREESHSAFEKIWSDYIQPAVSQAKELHVEAAFGTYVQMFVAAAEEYLDDTRDDDRRILFMLDQITRSQTISVDVEVFDASYAHYDDYEDVEDPTENHHD